MEYRNVGGSDLKVSVLCLGTATFGGSNAFFKAWGETDVAEATRLVDIALDAGVTLFDTADIYSDGMSEEILGQAIAGRRDRLLISTKASFRTGPGADEIGSGRKHLIAACEASLKRLGTDHIDLWQLHAFDALTPIEETLQALEELVRAGKVLHVGASNFSGWHLMKSLALSKTNGWPRHVAHQAYYSLLAPRLRMGADAARHRPAGGARWCGARCPAASSPARSVRDTPAPDGSRVAAQGGMGPQPASEVLYAIVDELRVIADEVGRSVSQVSLNWLLQRPTVATLVIGARNEAQLRDNLGAVEFSLSAEQMSRLDKVSRRDPVYPYWHQRLTFLDRNPPPTA